MQIGDRQKTIFTFEDDVIIASQIIRLGDDDTLFALTDDKINFQAGGKSLLALTETTQDLVEIGDVGGGGDVDINFNNGQMFLDYGNDVVLVNTITALTGVFGLAKLQIDRIDNGAVLFHRESADEGGSTLEFLKRRSGWGVLSDSDRLGTIAFSGADGTDAALALQIFVEVDGTPGNNDMPGRLIVAISPDDLATPTERLRIISTGKITLTGTTGIINLNADGSIEGGTTGGSFIVQPYSGSNNNILVNALSTGALYLNYLAGTGGILFGDGAVGVTGGVQSNGRMGLGLTSPQARLHTYDTIGGSLHNWIYDGLAGVSQVIIPDGTGDILYMASVHYVARTSAGSVGEGRFGIIPTNNNDIVLGADTLRFSVSAGGELSCVRQAGAGTIKVNVSVLWI